MKALTKRVKVGRISGLNIRRTSRVFNRRPLPYLNLLENEKEVLTDADMMRIFQVSRVTLYRWRMKGIVPFSKMDRNVYYLKQRICLVLLAKSNV